MICTKCKRKAMTVAAAASGVISVAVPGDTQLVVIGVDVDPVSLTRSLRKKVGLAVLISVEEVKPEDPKGDKNGKGGDGKKPEGGDGEGKKGSGEGGGGDKQKQGENGKGSGGGGGNGNGNGNGKKSGDHQAPQTCSMPPCPSYCYPPPCPPQYYMYEIPHQDQSQNCSIM